MFQLVMFNGVFFYIINEFLKVNLLYYRVEEYLKNIGCRRFYGFRCKRLKYKGLVE